MNYKDYFRSLAPEQRDAHALRAGRSADYINIHLIPRRKMPRADTMRALANASDGHCSYTDLLEYFYGDSDLHKDS